MNKKNAKYEIVCAVCAASLLLMSTSSTGQTPPEPIVWQGSNYPGMLTFNSINNDVLQTEVPLNGAAWTLEAWFNWPPASPEKLEWATLFSGSSGERLVSVYQPVKGTWDNPGSTYWMVHGAGAVSHGVGSQRTPHDLADLTSGWHHVAMVRANGLITFYLDGVLIGDVGDTLSGPIVGIGNRLPQLWEGFGRIGEVRIWGEERTLDQIRTYAVDELPPNARTNLLAYFKGDGGQAHDVTGNYRGFRTETPTFPPPLSFDDNQRYYLKVKDTDWCMHVHGASHDNGANVTQNPCYTEANNTKVVLEGGMNSVKLKFVHSGRCAHVHGGVAYDQTDITQWDCVEQNNLKWKIDPSPVAGYYYVRTWAQDLEGVSQNYCLHRVGHSSWNNHEITLNVCYEAPNILWRFVETD